MKVAKISLLMIKNQNIILIFYHQYIIQILFHSDIVLHILFHFVSSTDISPTTNRISMLRTFFIFLPFSVRYGKKCFFSIVGKSFDSVVRLTLIFYSFLLLVGNYLIFQKVFSDDITHLIHLFSLFILDD